MELLHVRDNTLSSKIDGYGFERTDESIQKAEDEFMSTYLRVLANRAIKWERLLGRKTHISNSTKVKRYCRKGIPSNHRALAWLCLSGAFRRQTDHPSLYRSLIRSETDPVVVDTITKDLHRTFPNNIYFSTMDSMRQPLFNVLNAIAHKNSERAYCQGMNFVAGLLLLVVKKEENVFWLLDTLMNSPGYLPDFYCPDMKALRTEQEVLGELVRWKLPQVHSHLTKLDVHWCLLGTKWFLCLFADVLPTETVLRIWDCFFNEGNKILLRVALTLIMMNQAAIMRCHSFPDVLTVFQEMVTDKRLLDCQVFMKSCFELTDPFPKSKIVELRQQCLHRVS